MSNSCRKKVLKQGTAPEFPAAPCLRTAAFPRSSSSALSHLFIGWEGSPTRTDKKRRTLVPTSSNLSTGGPAGFLFGRFSFSTGRGDPRGEGGPLGLGGAEAALAEQERLGRRGSIRSIDPRISRTRAHDDPSKLRSACLVPWASLLVHRCECVNVCFLQS